MHLAQIRLGRVAADARAMLDRLAHMRVALDAEPRDKADAALGRLAEIVPWATAHGGDDAGHGLTADLRQHWRMAPQEAGFRTEFLQSQPYSSRNKTKFLIDD